MKTLRAFIHAFGESHTYDPRTNLYLWFGLLWGLPVPLYYLALTHRIGAAALEGVLQSHLMSVFFLIHPLFFALLFGAMGSVRSRLERENERLIRELKEQAWTDPLTGIYNRRYVMEEFRNILRRARRTKEPVRAVLFDLDGFKAVNDKEGHLAGDVILQKAAAALRGATRQGDLLGRFGGDEFLLVAAGDAASVRAIVERCRASVHEATGLTISAGTAEARVPDELPEALIGRADTELAASKRAWYESKGITRR